MSKCPDSMSCYATGYCDGSCEDEEYTTWADMEREAEELITESMKRILTPDEAACLAFHARVRCIKPGSHHA